MNKPIYLRLVFYSRPSSTLSHGAPMAVQALECLRKDHLSIVSTCLESFFRQQLLSLFRKRNFSEFVFKHLDFARNSEYALIDPKG